MANTPERLRGIIHCHSKYSFDSVTSIGSYLRAARKYKLDFIVLTDHGTTAGSAALRKAAARSLPQLQVPLAAEYLTEYGDIIAVFLQSEIRARTLAEFVGEAQAQGALLLLPHPYVSHQEIPRLAEACDLIEVFNSRASISRNKRAEELATAANKRTFAGSDAHLSVSLGRVVLQLENRGDLRTSLIEGSRSWIRTATPLWEIGVSQLIKAWKRRDPSLAWRVAYRGMTHLRAKLWG